MGFDDLGWYSTEDLKLLINAGLAELGGEEKSLHATLAAAARIDFGGKRIPDAGIAAAQKRVDDLKARLEPLQAELQKRSGI